MNKKKNSYFLKKVIVTLLALGTSAILGVAQAEETPSYDLDSLVVTATRTPVKESEANANISVVTRKEIEKKQYQDLSEALKNVPGVTIQNYGTGVGYENSNWFRINGSDKIVILVDGIRVNMGGVIYPVKQINAMENIERIEVLKGAASALYGADAQGGVINIITRKVAGNKSTLTLTTGSYDKEAYSFMNQGRSGKYSWMTTVKKDIIGNFTDAHGYEVGQHSNADNFTFKLNKQLDDVSDITFNFENYKADCFYTESQVVTEKDTTYGAKRYGTNEIYDYRVTYNYKPSANFSNQLTIYTNVNKNQRTYANSLVWDPSTNPSKWKAQYPYGNYYKTQGLQDQFTVRLNAKHLLSGGYDYVHDEVVNAYSGGKAPLTNKAIINQAVYLQDEWDIQKDWKLTTGARYDHNSMFGEHFTPRVNLGYKQNEQTNYYVAYSKFFNAPTLTQLYSGTAANPDLDPETGNSTEFGVNHIIDPTLTANFHIFKRSSEGEIVSVASKYQNSSQSEANGWEAQLAKNFSKQLSAYAGYTYLHIKPNGATTGTADNLNGRIPRGLWNVGIDYQQDKYDAHLQGRGIIDKPGYLKPGARVTQCYPESTYWIWDMSLNYQLKNNTKLFCKVNNIFDKFYVENSSIASYGDGEPNFWWTNPGRNYQVGVQYQF